MRGQVLAIALVIAGGVAVTVLSLVNYSSLLATRAAYYEDYQFADVFVSLTRAPRYLEKVIAGIPGVHSLAARVEASARLAVPGFGEPVSARVLSLPAAGQPQVNRLFLRQGRLPRPGHTDETVIIQGFAESHNLLPGDTITAIINGRQQTLRITGVAESPEFIYVLPPGGLLPDYARYGVLWMSRETLAAAMDMSGAFNSLVVRVQPGYPVASVIGALDRLLARYGSTGAYAREDQVSHRMLDDELVQLRTMATVFPLVFMMVAMFLLNVVVQRLLNTQRDIVGVLKAFGYSNRQLGWHYSQLVLVIAFIGLVLGILSGIWLGRAMGALYMQYYRFPLLLFRLAAAGIGADPGGGMAWGLVLDPARGPAAASGGHAAAGSGPFSYYPGGAVADAVPFFSALDHDCAPAVSVSVANGAVGGWYRHGHCRGCGRQLPV